MASTRRAMEIGRTRASLPISDTGSKLAPVNRKGHFSIREVALRNFFVRRVQQADGTSTLDSHSPVFRLTAETAPRYHH